MITGRVLHAGSITAPTVALDEPLSFWGGFDATTGTIIDRAHPQAGTTLTGRVVVIPGSRGSAGTPGVLADAIRRGTGPAGIVLEKADINLTAGALVASALYGRDCPIVELDHESFVTVADWPAIAITTDGRLESRVVPVTPRNADRS